MATEEEPPPRHHLPKLEDDDYNNDDQDFNQNQHQPLHPNYPDNYPYPYPPQEQYPQPHMMNMPSPHPSNPRNTPPPPTPLRLPTPQKRSRTPTPPPPQQPPPDHNSPPPPTPRKPGPPPPAGVPAEAGLPPPRKPRAPPQYRDYNYDDDDEDAPRRRLCAVIFILLVLIGLAALILWLVYRPNKPKYTAVSAAVYSLNVTTPPLVSASVQITVLTRNSNKRTALSYDGLTATVYYRNTAITRPVNLPPLVQKKRSTVMMSPVVGGVPVAVPGDVANGLAGDEAYGVVGLSWVLMGRVKYRAGLLRSGHSRVYVKCDVLVGLSGATNGVFVNPPGQVPLLGTTPCLVDM